MMRGPGPMRGGHGGMGPMQKPDMGVVKRLLGYLKPFRLRLALVLVCLVELAGWVLPLQLRKEAVIATAMLTFASGIDYVIRYGVRAWQASRKSAP